MRMWKTTLVANIKPPSIPSPNLYTGTDQIAPADICELENAAKSLFQLTLAAIIKALFKHEVKRVVTYIFDVNVCSSVKNEFDILLSLNKKKLQQSWLLKQLLPKRGSVMKEK